MYDPQLEIFIVVADMGSFNKAAVDVDMEKTIDRHGKRAKIFFFFCGFILIGHTPSFAKVLHFEKGKEKTPAWVSFLLCNPNIIDAAFGGTITSSRFTITYYFQKSTAEYSEE